MRLMTLRALSISPYKPAKRAPASDATLGGVGNVVNADGTEGGGEDGTGKAPQNEKEREAGFKVGRCRSTPG